MALTNNLGIEDAHFFMATAFLVAKRSICSKKVGAIIVNDKNQIVGIGFNSFQNVPKNEKNYVYFHAESTAIANSSQHKLDNCSLYVNLHPCLECAKLIIQFGIKKVFYNFGNDKYPDSVELFLNSEVNCQRYFPPNNLNTDFRFFKFFE